MEEIYQKWSKGLVSLEEVKELIWKRVLAKKEDPYQLDEFLNKIIKENEERLNVRK